jgi:hypothetical protein
VNVIDEEEIALRAKAVLAQAASEEVGLHLQRTSPTIAGVFVRGLLLLEPRGPVQDDGQRPQGLLRNRLDHEEAAAVARGVEDGRLESPTAAL